MSSKRLLTLVFCLVLFKIGAQNWTGVANLNSTVRSSITDPNSNRIILTGSFSLVNQDTIFGIFSWDGGQVLKYNCGVEWDCYSDGVYVAGGSPPVLSSIYFNNNLYITGAITNASGETINGICYWNEENWLPVGAGLTYNMVEPSGIGYNLKVINEELYVCGAFNYCAGIQANGLAKFDGNSWSNVFDLPQFHENSYNTIYDVEIFNNEIYVCGLFLDEIGSSLHNLAKFNGEEWIPVQNGIRGLAKRMIVFNDQLIISGQFDAEGLNPITPSIISYNGTNWEDLGGGLGLNFGYTPLVTDMKVHNERLYICGQISEAGGIYGDAIFFWDNENWNSITPINTFQEGIVYTISFLNDTLYAAGSFRSIQGDTSIAFITKWIGGDHIEASGNTTTVEENKVESNIILYPNPSNDQFVIDFKDNSVSGVNIISVDGKVVDRFILNKNTKLLSVNSSNWARGIYLVNFQSDLDIFKTLKFIKN